MLLKTQTTIKFLNTASNILGKEDAKWAHLEFKKGNLHIGLSSNKGQATFDIPAKGKGGWKISIPVSTFLTLCSRNKEIEVIVEGRKVDFKAGKTHKGTINAADYSEVIIEKPKTKLPTEIIEILPKVRLGIHFNNEMVIARIRTEKGKSKILTCDKFHFAITTGKDLGDFDIPVSYVSHYNNVFEKSPHIGLHENFFIAWDDSIRLRLPLVQPSSEEVPFELATGQDLLKDVATKATIKTSLLKDKLENVCLALQDNELVEFKPTKKGIGLSVKSKIGKSEDFIECKVQTDGKPIKLSPYYLEDLLALVSGDIEFEFVKIKGANRVGAIRTKKQTLYMMASTHE